jgi:hypothetical protein
MKWVTRANVKVDRVACPWLIRTFVDPEPEFIFVAPDAIAAAVAEQGAIPFDAPGVELGHHGAECSFDAILKRYTLTEPALQQLALIVRGADTPAKDLTPESRGLEAVAEGFRRLAQAGDYDDHETNRREWIVYDALYLYCGGDAARLQRA